MKTTVLQEVTKKIQEACSDLMELTPGCKIKERYWKDVVTVISDIGDTEGHKYVYTTSGANANRVYLKQYYPTDNYITEILGHEIQLSHVLRAIEKSGFDDINRTLITRPNGKMEVVLTDDETVDREARWDLSRDWSGQSEETRLFVAGALGVE